MPNGNKAIRFTPENYEKIYLEWMKNHPRLVHLAPALVGPSHPRLALRRLPQNHRPRARRNDDPKACAHCGSEKITQETDVLDTWFSSGLLPVSVFGWPNFIRTVPQGPTDRSAVGPILAWERPVPPVPRTWGPGRGSTDRADFDAFYPTSLLVTGFDILFFWVARMIMLGCWFAGDIPMPDGSPRPLAESVPFKEVYIHALVRDANREKMSKTKGNVIDPIEIVKQYGTDAVRFTLASMASPGTDIAFNVARTEGYRAFANKIWNAARFIFMNVDRAAEVGITVDPRHHSVQPTVAKMAARSPLDRGRLNATAAKVNEALENYRFDDAASIDLPVLLGEFLRLVPRNREAAVGFRWEPDRQRTEGEILAP